MNYTMYSGFSEMVGKVGIEKTAEYAKGLGFTSVEIFSNSVNKIANTIPDVASARKAREVLDRYGLPVACYSVYANAWRDEESIQNMMEQVELAAVLGSPYVHHTMLPWIEMPTNAPAFDEAIDAAVAAAKRIANHAEKFGITCIYEDQGYYVNGVEGFGVFYREIKKHCKNVGVCGDLGNILFVNEKPEAFLAAYIDDVRHVHVKDYLQKEAVESPGVYWLKAKGKSWLRDTMVGHGVIDVEACMKILKDAGYNGAFALEISHPEPYERGVEQAMEYLKRFRLVKKNKT